MDTSHMYFPSSPCAKSSVHMAYKLSARAHARARANRRHVNLGAMTLSPRQQAEEQTRRHSVNFSMDTFRSPRLLEDVDQVEKNYQPVLLQQRSRLTPEQAIKKLRDAVLAVAQSGKGATFAAEEMLAGLEDACWQPFVPESSGKISSRKRPSGDASDVDDELGQQPRILYSQLLRGTEEILREEQAACQQLREQIQQVEERNNELPHMIQECQAAVTRSMESAVRGETLVEHKLSDASIHEETDVSPANVSATTATIREETTKMRKRKDLRTWACNDLRAGLNDLITRRSELKQQVSAVIFDMKKEEQANKLRAKRLEDLRIQTTASSLLPTGRVGSKTSTQQQLARLTLALAKNQVLQEAHRDRKALIRARTEAIFDVRIQLRELNDQHVTVEKALKDLEEEATNMKRAFTPRPDWSELHDATVVTTAVDRVDPSARMRMGATRNKLTGAKAADIEEDRASEQRLTQILSSNWSTIAKVGAMAAELAKIRSRDHAGDTLLAEQKKLKHLHKEIARLLQQLEAVKAQSAA